MSTKVRWARFLRTRAETEADELRAELDLEREYCQEISQCRAGELVSITGTVRYVTLLPANAAPAFEIELYDGSGSTAVIWLGRRMIPGIIAGRRLLVTGRMTIINGRNTIYNPRYQLKPLH
ncbi:MAG: OB-fold nucleic acid binding domain-containing protein [Candidatus Nanopelagicales bacterium]